jgi:hypothetical protein
VHKPHPDWEWAQFSVGEGQADTPGRPEQNSGEGAIRYLVVAHRTADSAELMDRLLALAAADPAAEFVLLVPATITVGYVGQAVGRAPQHR